MPGHGSRDSSNHASNVFNMPGPLGSKDANAAHHLAPPFHTEVNPGPPRKPAVDWVSILDQLPYGLIVLGPGQDLRHENAVCSELLGCSVRETGSIEAWLASACPDDEHRDRVINSWRDHIWRNQLTRTFTLRGADQKLREIEFHSSLQTDGVLTVTLQDVTDLRRAEETQHHNKLKFRVMFTHAGNGAVLVDRTGRIIDANPAFLRFAELTLKEIRLSTLASFLYPEDATALAQAEQEWRNKEEATAPDIVSREIWLRARTKEKRAEITYCPVGDSSKNPSMGIYLFEVGETPESREQLINKLRTVAAKAKALLNAVPDLVLLINDDLTVADFAPPPTPWKELQPDDSWHGQSLKEVWPVLSEVVEQSQLQVTAKGKTVNADVEGCGSAPFDFNLTLCSCGDGQMLAVVRNKTEEEAARFNGWSSPVFNRSSQAMIVTDADGRIREANPAFAKLVEIAPADLLGRPISELYHLDQGLEEHIASLLASEEAWTCPFPLLQKSGREIKVITEFVPVSEKGSPPCVVGMIQDAPSSDEATPLSPDKIQHGFRNQLQLVTSLFSLEPQGNAARDAFLKWQIRLRSVAQTMNGSSDTGVQVIPMLRAIADEICSLTGHGHSSREIEITGDETLRIENTSSSSLALMMGEIMRLILGHRQFGLGPQLSLSLHRDSGDNLCLRVKPGESRQFIFTDEDSEIEILEILTTQLGGELAPLASESALAWELKIPAERF